MTPLLLYDGTCGLCAASVQFVLAHERAGILSFAPLDGPTAAEVRRAHPWLDGIDSLVLSDDRGVSVRSTAALRLIRYLRWPWQPLRLAWLVPRAIRDRLYDLVATHRHRVATEACILPKPATRHRFLN